MTEILSAEERDIEGPGAVQWQGLTNATVARSSAYAHSGTNSLAITATTAAGTDTSLLVRPAAVAGRDYDLSVWMRNTINHYPTVYIRFYNSGGGLLSQASFSPSESLVAWYQATVGATAPANTTHLDILVQHFGNAAGDVSYIDDISVDDGIAAGSTGTIASTLPALTQSISGESSSEATAASTLSPLSTTATGESASEAAIASLLPAVTQSATGTSSPDTTGSIASLLPVLSQSLSAASSTTATASSTLPSLTQSATGYFGTPPIYAAPVLDAIAFALEGIISFR